MIGKIALRIKPNLLKILSKNIFIICVTGTNGKTTTCSMLTYALKQEGISCFSNGAGANMLNGVATAFIQNATIMGKPKCRYAVIECDENSFPKITKHIKPNVIVVTNIFRDQLDRYTEITITKNQIKTAIANSKDATVFLNADCPLTYSLIYEIENKVVTFGIDTDFSSCSPNDSLFCPVCNAKLFYDRQIFGHLGEYHCNCGFCRKTPNVLANYITKTNNGFSLCISERRYNIAINGIYNLYNFVASSAVLDFVSITPNKLCNFSGTFGRMEHFVYDNKAITLILVKNPVGFQNAVDFAISTNSCFDAIFCLNDNDADGKDISWIWDVNFEGLLPYLCSSSCFGTRASDMALRLKYSNISSSIYDENCNKLIKRIKNNQNDTVIFATYTYMMNVRHFLIKHFGGTEFWQ